MVLKNYLLNNIRLVFSVALICILPLALSAQDAEGVSDTSPFDMGLAPPASPEASAMATYGQVPVSMYTGTPDISIPIYTLQGKDISLPIFLTYDASGVKVSQIASWVGLGWNLNVGGAVTRQIIGKPDDYLVSNPDYVPFYSTSFDITSPGSSTVKEGFEFIPTFYPSGEKPAGQYEWYVDFMKRVKTGLYETQPDVYNFNAGGLSGTLFIDYDTETARCIEHPAILATPNFIDINGRKVITGWTIIDTNGTTYFFNKAEETTVYEYTGNDDYKRYNSAWLLTKIESERDVIDFSYSSQSDWLERQNFGSTATFQDYFDPHKDRYVEGTLPDYIINQSYLESISLNDSLVLIQLNREASDRLDLTGKKALDNIEIVRQGSRLKRYDLNQSYFDEGASSEYRLRLKLDSLDIYGSDLSTSEKQSYGFEYNPGSLPKRNSFAQDYWGYYNGADRNGSLIPYNYKHDGENASFQGANREPRAESAKTGTLNKITYPTGGSTTFEYQLHRQSNHPVTTTVGNITILSTQVTGGEDLADPFNFFGCDDGWGDATEKPIGWTQSFLVKETGFYRLSYATTGIPNESTGNFQMIVLYRSGDFEGCNTAPDGTEACSGTDTIVEPCEFLHPTAGPVERTYWKYGKLSENTVFNREYQLDAGNYRVLVLNTDPQINLALSVKTDVTTVSTVNDVGGLRVFKVQSTDDEEVKSTTYYHYGDLSKRSFDESLFSGDANGSGMLHQPPLFETPVRIKTIDTGTGGAINNEYWVRSSASSSKGHHHVTYPVVTEVSFGEAFDHGYTVHRFENSYSRYINSFSKNSVNNGKPLSNTIFGSNNAIKANTLNKFTEVSLDRGVTGFSVAESDIDNTMDIYVVSVHDAPETEFLYPKGKALAKVENEYVASNCAWNGSLQFLRSCDQLSKNDDIDAEKQAIIDDLEAEYRITPIYSFDEDFCRHIFTVPNYYRKIACLASASEPILYNPYLIPSFNVTLDQTIQTQFEGSDSLRTTTSYTYDEGSHYQQTESLTMSSEGHSIKEKKYYAFEEGAVPLINRNKIAEVLRQEIWIDDELTITHKKTYGSYGAKHLLRGVKSFRPDEGPLPSAFDKEILRYDETGNPLELTARDGITKVYLWWYDGSGIVAEIVNSTYDQVVAVLSNHGIADIAELTDEGSLETALNHLRIDLPQSLVTTYLHYPGVGVKKIKDPNGKVMAYEYDAFGRLTLVKRQKDDGAFEVLSAYEYHFGTN